MFAKHLKRILCAHGNVDRTDRPENAFFNAVTQVIILFFPAVIQGIDAGRSGELKRGKATIQNKKADALRQLFCFLAGGGTRTPT